MSELWPPKFRIFTPSREFKETVAFLNGTGEHKLIVNVAVATVQLLCLDCGTAGTQAGFVSYRAVSIRFWKSVRYL